MAKKQAVRYSMSFAKRINFSIIVECILSSSLYFNKNMNNGFQFKQFFIQHDRCAMKVNTDGILLACIADIKHAKNILDIGTGCGLIAIMLAQRTNKHCQITALELEHNAYYQAQENAKNSSWRERISVKQGDIMTQSFEQKFDLIVSNPPYFENSPANRTQERELARTIIQHTHLDWLNQAKTWLTENGRITFILPIEAAEKLILQSKKMGLYCCEQWLIITKVGKTAKRMIISFRLQEQECIFREVVIYDLNNQYTGEFKLLTQDFYLNF